MGSYPWRAFSVLCFVWLAILAGKIEAVPMRGQ